MLVEGPFLGFSEQNFEQDDEAPSGLNGSMILSFQGLAGDAILLISGCVGTLLCFVSLADFMMYG